MTVIVVFTSPLSLQVAEIISDLMEPLTGVAQDESTEDLFSTPSTLASKLRKAGLR